MAASWSKTRETASGTTWIMTSDLHFSLSVASLRLLWVEIIGKTDRAFVLTAHAGEHEQCALLHVDVVVQ
jgi:hypothetical protein